MMNPEYRDCYGMFWISEDDAFFIPEYSVTALYSVQSARAFAKSKGLRGKKFEKEAESPVDGLLSRVKRDRLVRNFVPVSGWLSAGKHHLEEYSSFLVGKGLTLPEVADIPSPTFDAREKALWNPKERKILRALFSGVLQGLLGGTPVVSPLVVLAGGGDFNRKVLRDLIVQLFGDGFKYSSAKSAEPTRSAASIFRYADDYDLGIRKGEVNFRNLRDFAQQRKLAILHKPEVYTIPAFSFVVMLSQLAKSCLQALPHPGAPLSHGVIVLSCDREITIPKLNPAERPGYFHRLLQEKSKVPDWYFAPDIQEIKFQKIDEKAVYDSLKNLCGSAPIIKTSGELRSDLNDATKDAQHCVTRVGLSDVLWTLARYRPNEIKQLDGERWEFNFANV